MPNGRGASAKFLNASGRDGIGLHKGNSGQPPALSYVDARTPGKRVQAPAVAISPTVPWTCADNGLDRQLPKPVKAAAKSLDNVQMLDVVEHSSSKPGLKDYQGPVHKEPEGVEMGGQEAESSPITAKVVISQASPLKRASFIADSETGLNDPNSLMKHAPLGKPFEGEKGGRWAATERKRFWLQT